MSINCGFIRIFAKNSNSVVKVEATRIIGDKETTEVRYYISSLPADSPFNTYIRTHREIENKLHWTHDMTFGEDQQRKRSKKAAENFSLIRKFTLDILKRDKSKLSLVNKRLKAAWDWGYLMNLLLI